MAINVPIHQPTARSLEPGSHILSTNQFSRADVEMLIHHAESLRSEERSALLRRQAGKVVATLFYEPSTRTRLSFESAALRLGAQVVGAENAKENSSAKKGETLQDVFRVVGSYVDAIVIRHHESDDVRLASPVSPVPIINAGTGAGEHPTQALLDLYTMWREVGGLDHIHVAILGDLKYGRTVHSLLNLLRLFDGITVTMVSPQALTLPQDMLDALKQGGLDIRYGESLEAALVQADVVYQTRIQSERLASPQEAEDAERLFLNESHLTLMKPTARILHPLPRVNEISPDVDLDPRAAYFRQVGNGLYMRMAILDYILGGALI